MPWSQFTLPGEIDGSGPGTSVRVSQNGTEICLRFMNAVRGYERKSEMRTVLCIMICAMLLLMTSCTAEKQAYTSTSVTDAAASAAKYAGFAEAGELSVLIPGLKEGFVPQGITWLPGTDTLLFAGYSGGEDNSALLEVNRETGELVRQVRLENVDGTKYDGHAGGVCATERDIYVSNAHKLYRLSMETYEKLAASAVCAFEEEIPVPVNASYCSYTDGILWVGEFQYGGDYPTDASHRVSTADGLQRAWTCGYRMVEGQDFSAPDIILSMTERIQGMTVKSGKIYLSQSYGRKNDSVLYRYADVLASDPDETAEVNGRTVPIWILDSRTREAALMSPPMTECLCTIGDEIYVVFESGAKTYMKPSNPSVNPMDRVYRLKDF